MAASDPQTSITAVLGSASGDGREILDRLVPVVYEELRGIARSYLHREARRGTLQTTALVHEAYLKLIDESRVPVRNRSYFFAAAARAMRQILVDAARRRKRLKRGAGEAAVALPEIVPDPGAEAFAGDLLDLHDALARFERHHPRAASVVEQRYFGGLSVDQVAATLDCSPRSVKRDWAFARAWLYRDLHGDSAE